MEITLNTEVKDILNHKDVFAEMDAVVPKVRSLIQRRWDTIKAQMASGAGLGQSQTVNGDPIFYDAVDKIALEYTLGFWSDFNWTVSLMRSETFEKESEELYELQRLLINSNNDSGTSDEQKKKNSDKLAEIDTRLRTLKDSILNDKYNEWDDGTWRESMLKETGLTEPPTEPTCDPTEPPTVPETTEPPKSGTAPSSDGHSSRTF